jgi:hypothetical protein
MKKAGHLLVEEITLRLARYDSDLHNHLESPTGFCGSPDIQNELIHSVSELMTVEIKKEISKANFFFFSF